MESWIRPVSCKVNLKPVTLQETRSIQIPWTFQKSNYILNRDIIYNLENKTVLYLMCNRIECKTEKRNSQREQDSQWSIQEALVARAAHVWLAVNHNTSVTSGEWIRCSKSFICSTGCPCSSWLFRFSILHRELTVNTLYLKYKTVLIPKLKIIFIF